MSRLKIPRDLYALAAYFFLTLVLTYPLILNFTTHVAGDGGDDPALAWNLWWVPYSLVNLGSSPIYTNYMFFPIGLNLGFYTLTYLNAFLAIPFQFAFGIIPAANINLILSFTLSGFGAYLLVTYLLRRMSLRGDGLCRTKQSHSRAQIASSQSALLAMTTAPMTAAAFAAGLVYAFSANKFLYASLGQFNIASSQWIPFYILFLLKIFDSPKPPLKYGFLLGLFLLAQSLSEFIFASFLILFSIAFVIYKIISGRGKIENRKSKIKNLLCAALVFVLPMLPIFAALFADTVSEGDFIQQGLGFSNIFSADVLGFFIPSQLHPLFGSLQSLVSFPYINFMYLGFVALALAIIAVIKIKPARIWGVWFLLFALISLGPTLRINGAEFDLPMPFDALLEIPLIKGNRYPSRWSVMLTLSLAVMVGYGLAWIMQKVVRSKYQIARPLILATCYLLLVFEPLSTPLPISNLQSPAIYSEIARDAGNFSVMEIPLAWRNGFRVTGSYRRDSFAPIDRIFMYAQFYQTTQQHPILNGNTSRNPELKFQYFFEAPVLNSLIAIQTGHEIDEATRARDKELAPRVLQFFGTRYIIWHTPFEETNRDVANKTRAYIEEIFPVTKISESYENGRGVVVYRVAELAALWNAFEMRSDSPYARLFFGEGWGPMGEKGIIATRQHANLFFPLAEPRDTQVTLYSFGAEGGLSLYANGKMFARYDSVPVTGGENRFAFIIPKALTFQGLNELSFQFDKLRAVRDAGASIVVRSAGEEQGAFGHIYVNGVEESPNARGYNIVVVNQYGPNRGKVIARANFDTFASAQESERMAEFLSEIPGNTLIAVAASDEASLHLTENAVNALKALGAKQDLRGKFRWSHAFLVEKDRIETAREAASEIQVSQVFNASLITEPYIAATFEQFTIEPAP